MIGFVVYIVGRGCRREDIFWLDVNVVFIDGCWYIRFVYGIVGVGSVDVVWGWMFEFISVINFMNKCVFIVYCGRFDIVIFIVDDCI